jgi:hypothetical protein
MILNVVLSKHQITSEIKTNSIFQNAIEEEIFSK